jgi:hypothetical protein
MIAIKAERLMILDQRIGRPTCSATRDFVLGNVRFIDLWILLSVAKGEYWQVNGMKSSYTLLMLIDQCDKEDDQDDEG